ncbi:MAG: KH domain-containing protein [Armatimonadetes bacterium]|nr:KH domain-containing protein [Armatimonadota bacterium]
MSQVLELTAKSVEEAKTQAAAKLSVSESEIEITVLEQVKGLFGKSSVRVRAEVMASAVAAEKPAAKPKATKAAKPAAKAKVEEPAEEAAPVVEAVVEAVAAAEEPKKARSGRGKKAADAPAPAAKSEEGEEGAPDVVASAADGEALLGLLKGMLDAGKLQVNAEVSEISGRYVNIKLDGKDVAYLVGKHGEVLNSLQYVLNISASRKIANGVRATLDGNDFRRRREDKLTQHAQRVADEVIKRGDEAVLEAMPAFDRRIVHKALMGYAGVATYSEGEEPNRRVVIAPAD